MRALDDLRRTRDDVAAAAAGVQSAAGDLATTARAATVALVLVAAVALAALALALAATAATSRRRP